MREALDEAAKNSGSSLNNEIIRRLQASCVKSASRTIVTISRGLGHANPDIPLQICAQLLRKDDSRASAATNDAFAALGP